MEPPKVGTLPLSCPLKCPYNSICRKTLEYIRRYYAYLFLNMTAYYYLCLPVLKNGCAPSVYFKIWQNMPVYVQFPPKREGLDLSLK